MLTLEEATIAELWERAAASRRGRANHNFHPRLDDPIQRFLNAMAPGTYVRPHRHPAEDAWEGFLALAGSAACLTFSGEGTVRERVELSARGPVRYLEVGGGVWHTVVPLEAGTVLFELKQGPYRPLTDKDFASWAPAEGERGCPDFVVWFCRAVPGNSPPVHGRSNP